MASEDLFAEVFDISTDIGQLPENKDVLLATNKVRNQELATSSIDEQNIISLADHDKPTCAEVLPGSAISSNKVLQLPPSRIRNLMKLDPDVQVINQEIVFMVARSSELFIEALARESYRYTKQAKRKTIQISDVNLAISAVDSLMFLDGTMDF